MSETKHHRRTVPATPFCHLISPGSCNGIVKSASLYGKWAARYITLIFLMYPPVFWCTAGAQPHGRGINRVPAQVITDWLKESHVPAAGLAIIEAGKLSEARVYRSAGPSRPAEEIFNVASLTKPVVAAITLMLADRQQWELDAPLAAWWIDPDVASDPHARQLTTRHVLSHRTGFVNWRWEHPGRKLTFDFAPGTGFGYSGEGFEYLRKALEARFAVPLEQLADSMLFRPLRMDDTRFYWKDDADLSRFAFEYDRQGKQYEFRSHREASAADDLLTTVTDYGKFCAGVLNGRLMSKQRFAEMVRPETPVNPGKQVYWGLGWELITGLSGGEYVLYHGGSDRGVRAGVLLFPESGRGLIIFTNGDGGMEILRKITVAALKEGEEIIGRLSK